MTLDAKHCGAVILAGGQSRRMGTCKALLPIQGETMLSRLTRQLSDFDERLLSANDPALGEGLPLRFVPDLYPGAGPAAGIHAALSASRHEALFCVSCDLPNFDSRLPALLLERFEPGTDALVCRGGNGRLHPLCGIYTKSALPVLGACLQSEERRMTAILRQLRCQTLDTGGILPDEVFFNMNTPEAFRLAADK